MQPYSVCCTQLVKFGVITSLVFCASTVLAHGSMKFPASRTYLCAQGAQNNSESAACKQAYKADPQGENIKWVWHEVNTPGNESDKIALETAVGNHRSVVPDGKLCSVGQSRFKGLDDNSLNWESTPLQPGKSYEFDWDAPSPHTVGYVDYYITKPGVDISQPLTWDMLEKLPGCAINTPKITDSNDPGKFRSNCIAPQRADGEKAIIYGIWHRIPPGTIAQDHVNNPALTDEQKARLQSYINSGRSDSNESFYACADVTFTNDSTTPPTNNHWGSIGKLTADHADYPVGTKITFNLTKNNQTVTSYTTTLNYASNNYVARLAETINASKSSPDVRIGDLVNDEVIWQPNGGQQVYVDSKDASSYHFSVKVQQPDQTQSNWQTIAGEGTKLDGKQPVAAGDKITFRLQQKNSGIDYLVKTITLTNQNNTDWPYYLAKAINQTDNQAGVKLKVGVKTADDTITPAPNSAVNQVYVYTDKPEDFIYRIKVEQANVPTGNCRFKFDIGSQWDNGMVANVTIYNDGNQPLTDWTVSFAKGNHMTKVDNLWSGIANADGNHIIVKPESWNATIQPNGHISFGFQATTDGNYQAPTELTLNGEQCQAAS